MNPSIELRLLRAATGLALLTAVLALLTSCNTTAGLGRDLRKAGNKIESEAHEHM